MEVIGGREDLRRACNQARAEGRAVGFIPTMGFLHEGHASLLGRARRENGFVTMSLFVNPLQFGPTEDLAGYPRDLDRDLAIAEREGVDLMFAPPADEMYPDGTAEVTVDPGPLGDRLEGASRPGHFRGVCTVVAKLFDLVGPSRAYFGEKDAQQLAVIRRMVVDLDMPVEVVGCPTVREADGLALSSRNGYLSTEDRRAATCLFEALTRAADLVEDGERDAEVLRVEMAKVIETEPLAELDYATVVEEATFVEVDRLTGPARALVAARFGKARLIDNLSLSSGPAVTDNH
jgi:pantoate--beta-alanine ligase